MRVALYARYSSDQQRTASNADQLRDCRARVDREGWTVACEFSDAELSGENLIRRPGVQGLIEACRRGQVDIVLCESLDRLSRDIEDTAGLFKRLSFAGVRIVTLSEGAIDQLHVGFKGTMNALYLRDLADKTRRGLRGRVEAGKSAGGLCYGYRVVPVLDGQPRGDRTIADAEAHVVRRIFQMFADGRSPIAIAKLLNAEGVPGPDGHVWAPTMIRGHAKRGTGILNNDLYVGRIVWNRLRYVKNPDTGLRQSRLNPPSEWVTKDVPDLRIVDDELWHAVKARQAGMRRELAAGAAFNRLTRPKYVFSGLTKCGECGSTFTLASHDRLACTTHRLKGQCSNAARIARGEVEARVLQALREDMLDPELFADFCDAFTDELNRGRRAQRVTLANAKRELAEVERDKRAIVNALKAGLDVRTIAAELRALEAREDALLAIAAAAPPPTLHPKMADVYRDKVTGLCEALASCDDAAGDRVRGLIERITIHGDRSIVVHGDLAAMLRMGSGVRSGESDSLYRAMQVVAGARNDLYSPLFQREYRCA